MGKRFGEFAKFVAFLAVVAPFVSRLLLRQRDFLWRRDAVIEQAIQRQFERASVFLERFDRRNRVTVFDPRGVAADQSRALLDVALAEIFQFAKLAKSLSD
ncbi:MAG: hypothetical protein WBQ34_10610 [Candidatus Acidiferrales bacterium]